MRRIVARRLDALAFTRQSSYVDVTRALEQIAEIHGQMAKGELYRGYRARWVGGSAAGGVIAAWLQPASINAAAPAGFVSYWCAVAVGAAIVGAGEMAYDYAFRHSAADRRQTRRVVGQFMPSVVAGAGIAVCFAQSSVLVAFLPGVWAICFGLGIFASRPYLPRASGWVALFYYAAGFGLLWMARRGDPVSGWWIGATFGIGQVMAAAVLWWNLEREESTEFDGSTDVEGSKDIEGLRER